MNRIAHWIGRGCAVVAVLLGGHAWGKELAPTNLPTAEAAGFVGTWVLTMTVQNEPVEVELRVEDVGGKLGAIVAVPQLPDPIVATDMVRTASGVDMAFPMRFGDQTITLTLSLEQKVSGTLADDAGLISTAVEGVRAAEPMASAPTLKTSELDTASMGSYIGAWELAMSIGARDVSVTLQFVDVEGKVAALFQSPFNPEPETISNISLSEEGARVAFDATMRGQSAPVEIWITEASETLVGTFSVAGGALRSDFVGSRTEKDLLAALSSVDEATRRRSRGGGTQQAELTLDGHKIRVRYTAIKGDSDSLKRLDSLNEGDVFTYSDGRTIKLFTDADLIFGDTVLKTENAGPDYPGVYGLWLKREADGWRMVANKDADILGSQYDTGADVASFPLEVSDAGEDMGPLTIELEQDGVGGLFKLYAGASVWSAPFTLGEHAIAQAE